MPPVLVWSGAVSTSNWTHVAVVYSDGVPSLYEAARDKWHTFAR
jgi:hypothetical protein